MRPVKFVQIKFLVLHKVCIDRHQFNPYFAESTLTGTAPAMLVYQPNKSGEKFWREIFCKIQTGLQPVAEELPLRSIETQCRNSPKENLCRVFQSELAENGIVPVFGYVITN